MTIDVPANVSAVQMHYRHVDQAENYQTLAMRRTDYTFTADVPAAYTQTEFPLQYYFEVSMTESTAVLHPGFNLDLASQPYFTVRSV